MNFRKAIFPFIFCLLAAGAVVKLLAIREALLQINPSGILLLTVAVLILLWGHGIRAYKATLLVQPIKILTPDLDTTRMANALCYMKSLRNISEPAL